MGIFKFLHFLTIFSGDFRRFFEITRKKIPAIHRDVFEECDFVIANCPSRLCNVADILRRIYRSLCISCSRLWQGYRRWLSRRPRTASRRYRTRYSLSYKALALPYLSGDCCTQRNKSRLRGFFLLSFSDTPQCTCRRKCTCLMTLRNILSVLR